MNSDPSYLAALLGRWEAGQSTEELIWLRELTLAKSFHRIWTTQEIGLATRAVVMIGDTALDWDIVYKLFRGIETKLSQVQRLKYGLYTEQVTLLYRSFAEDEQRSFLKLICQTRNRGATDPRDRIYALMSHPNAKNPSTSKPVMSVNYNMPWYDVYRDSALAIIGLQDNLDVFSYVERMSNPEKASSWMPSWHSDLTTVPLIKISKRFNACGEHKHARAYPTPGDDRLQLEGVELDSVSHWVDWTSTPYPGTSAFNRICEAIARSQHYLSSPLRKLVMETLTAGALKGSDQGTRVISRVEVDEGRPQWEVDDAKDVHYPNLSVFRTAIQKACKGRKLFRTQAGLVGIGPQSLETDHRICLLAGGRTPYALKVAYRYNEYELIGECYVHGAMRGQMWPVVGRNTFILV